MNIRSRLSLIIGVWAILVGAVALLASFYLGFRSSLEEEKSALRSFVVQDSLLFVTDRQAFELISNCLRTLAEPGQFDLQRDMFHRTSASLRSTRRANDSLFAKSVHTGSAVEAYVSMLDSVLTMLDEYFAPSTAARVRATLARSLLSVDSASITWRLHTRFEELHERNLESAAMRISGIDAEVERRYSVWVLFSFALIIAGLVLAVSLTVADRRRSLQHQRTETLLRHTHTALVAFDIGGRATLVNDAFREWLGMGPVGGQTIDRMEYFKPRGAGQNVTSVWSDVVDALRTGLTWTAEGSVRRESGEVRDCTVVAFPVHSASGLLAECIVYHADTTEQRRWLQHAEEAQRQYQHIVESSLDGIVVIQDGKPVYANPTAVKLFGFASAEELQVVHFLDLLGSWGKAQLGGDLKKHSPGDELLRDHELRGLTKQGRLIDLEANAQVIIWNDRPAVQASIRDITERKMLEREQALWLWEQETLTEIDRRLVGVVDLQRILDGILQHTMNLTKSPWVGVLMREEGSTYVRWRALKGNRTSPYLNPFDPGPGILAILANAEPLVIQELAENTRFHLSTVPGIAEEGVVSSAWLPLKGEGEVRGVLTIGYRNYHDFSGREMRLLLSLGEKTSIALANATLYEHLLEREQELEMLSGARVKAQEEERRRIAREIHDGLGQMLTAIKLNLEILEDAVDLAGEERRRVTDMKSLLDSVMQEAREISYNLMPSVLDDFGLAPALQLLCERVSSRSGIQVTFHAHGMQDRLSPTEEISLYRIVQEALNNATRHAEATEIGVQVIRHDRMIRLTVEDNGRGMPSASARQRRVEGGGMGLASMRERASSFNGTLTIDSSPGKGTLVAVEIPLEPEGQGNGKDQNPAR